MKYVLSSKKLEQEVSYYYTPLDADKDHNCLSRAFKTGLFEALL